MKHKLSFLLLYGVLVLFGGLGAMVLLFGEREPRASETENRMLAGFPDLSVETVKDGSFMSGLEDYLSDNMPERDELVTQADMLMSRLSLEAEDDEAIQAALYEQVLAMGQEQAPTPEPTETPEPTPTPVPTVEPTPEPTPTATAVPEPSDQNTPAPAVTDAPTAEPAPTPTPKPKKDLSTIPTCTLTLTERNGKKRLVYTYSPQAIRRMVKALNAYRAVLPEDGHVFFAQPLFQGVVYELSNGSCTGWQSDLEDTINEYSDEGVYMASVPKILEQPLLNGEYLYYKTDHHWTPRAACYTLNDILETMGIDPKPYDSYSFRIYKKFYGSASNKPRFRSTHKPDTLEVMRPTTPVKGYRIFWDKKERKAPLIVDNSNTYMAFLGGTLGPWRRFETGLDSGRRCLVIGDSFSNCFVPFLTTYYEVIHVTDIRPDYYDRPHATWTISQYIQKNGIDDVYLVLSTANGVNTGYLIQNLLDYL